MTLEALLSYAHLLAVLTVVVFMASEAALCRPEWLNAAVVERLVRVQFGPVRIGELASGAWRELSPREAAMLEVLTGTDVPAGKPPRKRDDRVRPAERREDRPRGPSARRGRGGEGEGGARVSPSRRRPPARLTSVDGAERRKRAYEQEWYREQAVD